MGSVLVIERADGGTSVVYPTPEHVAKHNGNEILTLTNLQGRVVPGDAVSSEIVDVSVLPDRTFRDAWKKGSGTVTVDMPIARTIHMDRIREVRDAKLAEEDINWNKAVGQAAKDVVEARRQILRDIPSTSQTATDIAAATTPQMLDAIWAIAELGSR